MRNFRTCKQCQMEFEITEANLDFYDSISPIFDGKKIAIPSPTHCPDCRQQRRLAQCNERFLYPDECDLCHKKIISQYPPHLAQPVYCRECWSGDSWDPRDYGVDYDFNRSFFEQFLELRKRVPAQNLSIDGTNINSDYMHYAGSSKNSYLIAHADFCEDCMYGYGFKNNRSCVDGFYNLHCELCYDCVDVHRCYGLMGSQDCQGCHSSAFLRDCIGCRDCFLCVGLRNKQYCFENKQLTKKEYENLMAKINFGSYTTYEKCKRRLRELEQQHTFKALHQRNVENCFGDYLINCKNVEYSFDCEDVEDGKFCYQVVLGSKNVYDIYQYGTKLQNSYESSICGAQGYNILFTQEAYMGCQNVYYSAFLDACKNCFGCANMHHQKYCILNKQYSKEEYEKMVPRIIQHMQNDNSWGEFLPIKTSLFGYNKTTAQLYYPLQKNEALTKEYRWDEYEPPRPNVSTVISAMEIPDNIRDVTDEILNAAIECEISEKLFKITPNELRFYRDQKIPLPRKHPDQRHLDRFKKRTPRKFLQRECAVCKQMVWTTYPPEQAKNIACEKCYLKKTY